MTLSLNACMTNGVKGSYNCYTFRPMHFSPEDKVSRRLDKEIITNNEAWEALCK